MARRVLLHVGCPKTGTSFLQGVLWSNRDALAEQGLLVPLTYHHHYRASLVVRDAWRSRPAAAEIEAAWRELTQVARDADGDVLVTHESLAAATAEQARSMTDAFADAEVHVVVTARDLARQLPAEWQQSIKQGSVRRLDEFVERIAEGDRGADWFWRVQDVPDVLRRWGADLPPDRVHLVTVPPKGADASLLWSRFAAVIGVDPKTADLHSSRRNESLGSVEVELLRRINEDRGDRFPIMGNHRWFKDVLANRILANREDKQKFALPADRHTWLLETSAQMVDSLREQSFDLVGDLEELIPPTTAEAGRDPGTVAADDLLRAATDAILDLLDLHRDRVERLETWRDLAVQRGGRLAELEQRLQQQTDEVTNLERRRVRVRARRALDRTVGRSLKRVRRTLRRPGL